MQLQVGVKVLIKDNSGKLLFIRRSKPLASTKATRWDIPGGRIDVNERLEEALIREIREETGLHLSIPFKLISAQDIIVTDANLHVVRLTYITEAKGSEMNIKLSDEHQDFQWLHKREALGLAIDPQLREVLQTV